MRDGQRKCSNCRYTIPFICKPCQTEIREQCLRCHKNNQHQGRYFDRAVKCPHSHCGELTKAPTPEQWAVFIRSEVFHQTPQEVVGGGVLTNPNSVRTMLKAMPRLCNCCQERIVPPIEDLKILLYLGGAFTLEAYEGIIEVEIYKQLQERRKGWEGHDFKPTQKQTAEHFAKTENEVRKIYKEVMLLYGETIQRCSQQGRLRMCTGEGQPGKPENPMNGWGWSR